MLRLPVVLVVLAALSAGCGGTDADDEPAAKNSGIVPPSVTASPVTAQQRSFGQSAKVAFRPNQQRSTTLDLTVALVRAGRIRDLAQYALDDQAKASRPYYVRVVVTNDGPDDVGGSLLPLWATTSAGAVVSASSFAQPFARCRSTPLPKPFASGATARTCLLFLLPRSETLESLTNRTASGDVAASWKGTVKPPRTK